MKFTEVVLLWSAAFKRTVNVKILRYVQKCMQLRRMVKIRQNREIRQADFAFTNLTEIRQNRRVNELDLTKFP